MPAPNTIECPHCGSANLILPGTANRRWLCDACGGLIDLRTPAEVAAASSEAPEPEPARVHASRWLEGLSPEQQAAIRAELAADPDMLRNELARVRRETTHKALGSGTRSPVLRLIAAAMMLGGVILTVQPFAVRFLGRFGEDLAIPEVAAMGQPSYLTGPIPMLLGLASIVAALALAVGRRWGAHASVLLVVLACFLLGFHPAVVTFALGIILALFVARKALE